VQHLEAMPRLLEAMVRAAAHVAAVASHSRNTSARPTTSGSCPLIITVHFSECGSPLGELEQAFHA